MSLSMSSRILLALCAVCVGCGSDPGPTDIPPEPEVIFEPTPGTIQLEAYETAEFSALADDGTELTARWSINGLEQGSLIRFQFVGAQPGSFELSAEVEWKGKLFHALWQLQVSEDNTSVTPPVPALRALPGALPGSIDLLWERPSNAQIEVPLSGFDLFISESSFGEDDLGAMTPVTVPLDPVLIQQNHRFENLPEKALHHMGVRARDVLDRVSTLSAVVDTVSTGHFDVVGSVVRLQPNVAALKGPGVLVELGDHKTVTGLGGTFELLNLPDLLQTRLRIAEESGLGYFELRSIENWPAQTQNIDMTLFVRDLVFIDDGNPDGGFVEQLSTLEFLRYMSHNASRPLGVPHTVYRWDQYPVQVYVPPFVHQGLEPVDYRLSFERGVAAWNLAVGETLLEIVDEPVSVGVDYTADLVSDIVSGETVQLAPVGAGGIFQSIPERMRIRLIKFPSQVRADLVIVHELGHVLMLNHSPSNDHIMVAAVSTASTEPHRDEAFAARLIANLPQEFDLRWYRDPSGKRAVKLPVGPVSNWCGTGPVVLDRAGW